MSIHESYYTKRFQAFAEFYKDSESPNQVEFIEKAVSLKPHCNILDLACGYGRHSILLAKKGYSVTGYDLSADYINQARQEAERAGVNVTFDCTDMRSLDVSDRFDAVISFSTSLAFYEDKVNRDIFQRIYKALRPHGVFLFDQANLFWVISLHKHSGTQKLPDGRIHRYKYSFDAGKCILSRRSVLEDEKGCCESGWDIRYYTLPELHSIFKEIGFNVLRVYGNYDSSPYRVESNRLILILKKPNRVKTQIGKC